MELQLTGDHALVVGAARGIGRAIALEFAREGARVTAVDRDPLIEQLADEPRAAGCPPLVARQADATCGDAMRAVVDSCADADCRCLHVVYAAGVGSGGFGFPFWNIRPEDWEPVWRVNVLGMVHVAHAAARHWTRLRSGTLLLLSSIAGQIGSQTDPPYSAAKAAVINFGQCAAKDLAPYGVRVNTLCPGMIRTELNRSVWQAWNERQPEASRQSYEQWADDKIRRTTPLGRWQEPEDVAAFAAFLASRRASNVTGQTLNVDGGTVMHW